MSGNHTAGEVKLYLLRNFELEAFALGGRSDNPKRVLLRAWRIDMKGLTKKI